MTAPKDCIQVSHGKLTVNVPSKIFSRNGEIVAAEYEKFADTVRKRYPWISENAAEIIVRNAQKEYLRKMDEKSNGLETARILASQGKYQEATERLEKRLKENPNDADAWYLYGEYLCKCGKTEEGYKAINKGKSLIE